MIRDLCHKLGLTLIILFFPPVAVLMLCGAETDLLLNSVFFLCAVLPSHIHASYISWVYFHRKRKVRKGRWPGGPRALIYSRHVLNGGASDAEVRRLWEKENGLAPSTSRRSGRSSSRRGSEHGGALKPYASRSTHRRQRQQDMQRYASASSARGGVVDDGYSDPPLMSHGSQPLYRHSYVPRSRTTSRTYDRR